MHWVRKVKVDWRGAALSTHCDHSLLLLWPAGACRSGVTAYLVSVGVEDGCIVGLHGPCAMLPQLLCL